MGHANLGLWNKGWISFLLIQAIKHHPITIYWEWKTGSGYTYIDDLIRLFQEYLEWPQRQVSRVFNVGSGVHDSVSFWKLLIS